MTTQTSSIQKKDKRKFAEDGQKNLVDKTNLPKQKIWPRKNLAEKKLGKIKSSLSRGSYYKLAADSDELGNELRKPTRPAH